MMYKTLLGDIQYNTDKESREKIYTQDSFLFFKEKLPWVGFESTTTHVLGERSTN